MDISRALGIAKNLKNHFRAFEDLDEFINEAVALKNLMNELDTRKVRLQKEIEVLEQEKKDATESARKVKEEKKKHMDAMWEKMGTDFQNRKEQLTADLSGKISDLEAKKNRLTFELSTMEATHAETMERIQKETVEAEETLKVVEKKIRDIKAKLE